MLCLIRGLLATITERGARIIGSLCKTCRYDACDVSGEVNHWCTVNHFNYPFFEVRRRLCMAPEESAWIPAPAPDVVASVLHRGLKSALLVQPLTARS
jgi:hypothetical protein